MRIQINQDIIMMYKNKKSFSVNPYDLHSPRIWINREPFPLYELILWKNDNLKTFFVITEIQGRMQNTNLAWANTSLYTNTQCPKIHNDVFKTTMNVH